MVLTKHRFLAITIVLILLNMLLNWDIHLLLSWKQDDHKSSRDIFFVQVKSSQSEWTPMCLCALESAALRNSDKMIRVVIQEGSPLNLSYPDVLGLDNLRLETMNFDSLAMSSPASDLWLSRAIQTSNWSMVHTSDLVRLVLLYKHGGIYFDTDVISLRKWPSQFVNSLAEVPQNPKFAKVCNGILDFEPNHPFVLTALQEFNEKYNQTKYGGNGPLLLSRLLPLFCTSNSKLAHQLKCRGFKINEPKLTYPISWQRSKFHFITPGDTKVLSSLIEDAVIVHVPVRLMFEEDKFNPLDEFNTTLSPNLSIFQLMKDKCPMTYSKLTFN